MHLRYYFTQVVLGCYSVNSPLDARQRGEHGETIDNQQRRGSDMAAPPTHLDVPKVTGAVLLVLSAGLAHHHAVHGTQDRVIEAPDKCFDNDDRTGWHRPTKTKRYLVG